MANRKQVLLLVPSMLVVVVLLLPMLHGAESVSRIQVCGSRLSETIYAVCRGKFVPIQQRKRGTCEYMLQCGSSNCCWHCCS